MKAYLCHVSLGVTGTTCNRDCYLVVRHTLLEHATKEVVEIHAKSASAFWADRRQHQLDILEDRKLSQKNVLGDRMRHDDEA